jgi:hypothetical protein
MTATPLSREISAARNAPVASNICIDQLSNKIKGSLTFCPLAALPAKA